MSSSKSLSSKKAKKGTECRHCQVTLKQGDNSVECEVCSGWFHGACVGFDAKAFNILSIGGVHWLCKSCDGNFSQLAEIEREIKSTRALIEKGREEVDSSYNLCSFDDRMKAIEKGLATLNEAVSESCAKIEQKVVNREEERKNDSSKLWSAVAAMPDQISQVFEKVNSSLVTQIEVKGKVEKDSEFRSKNLVLFGITEHENREEWVQQVNRIIGDCHVDLSLDKSNSYRLGRFDSTKHTERPRPLRICTKSEGQMWELLSRINSLKVKGVFARKDLTKEEQEKDFRLRKELKQMRDGEPEAQFKIRKGKVVKIKIGA